MWWITGFNRYQALCLSCKNLPFLLIKVLVMSVHHKPCSSHIETKLQPEWASVPSHVFFTQQPRYKGAGWKSKALPSLHSNQATTWMHRQFKTQSPHAKVKLQPCQTSAQIPIIHTKQLQPWYRHQEHTTHTKDSNRMSLMLTKEYCSLGPHRIVPIQDNTFKIDRG